MALRVMFRLQKSTAGTADRRPKWPRGDQSCMSLEGLRAVRAVLSDIREARLKAERAENLRRDMVGKLWDRVYKCIPRREIADLWPTQPWKELGGTRPIDYCKDEKTLARCIEVLEDFSKNKQKRRR